MYLFMYALMYVFMYGSFDVLFMYYSWIDRRHLRDTLVRSAPTMLSDYFATGEEYILPLHFFSVLLSLMQCRQHYSPVVVYVARYWLTRAL